MGTTTQTALRQSFLETIDDWFGSLDLSGNGASDGTTIVDTGLKAWDAGQDDYYNNWWVKLTSGTYSGQERLVSDYTSSSGTITVGTAFGGQVLSGVTYEIMPWEPAKIRAALNQARLDAFPYVYKKAVDDTGVISGNWGWNFHFEDFTSSAFDHMALSGTPTMTQESTIIRGPKGSKAAKFTGGSGASYMYQSQVENPALLDLAGQTINFYSWAFCGTASKAQTQIYTKTNAGTETTTNCTNMSAGTGSYHTGGSEYELLGIESLSIPQELSDIQFRWVNTATTAYFDGSYAVGPSCQKLHLPKQFTEDPDVLEYQVTGGGQYKYYADDVDGIAVYKPLERGVWRILDDATDRFIVLNTKLPFGRKLRITGRELLTSLSTTEADTMEVSSKEATGLVKMAVSIFYERMSSKATTDDVSRYQNLAQYWKGKAMEALRGPNGMKAPWNEIRRF